ncbi:MAG: hypothetical protein OEX82_06685 [Nitrosomonas sp.]|nr:hypothetical protein [Nitrosomonas sp.]
MKRDFPLPMVPVEALLEAVTRRGFSAKHEITGMDPQIVKLLSHILSFQADILRILNYHSEIYKTMQFHLAINKSIIRVVA